MTASEPSFNIPHVDAAEAQLQQELQAMFALDTQQHLQAYFEVVQQLNTAAWTADIQHIYRAVHTVKGGAVTVEAEATLRAATVLEDLLSDLRYLDPAPPLEDGQLSRMLQEAGDLLSSTLEIKGTGEDAIASVQPTLARISALHEQIKQRYIPDWNELTQVHQEFAEQGFDLVILDLEMAVNQLPVQGSVSDEAIQLATQTLAQLTQIGVDLQFEEGWTMLVQCCQTLSSSSDSAQWHHSWPLYFQALKECAKNSGRREEEQLVALKASVEEMPIVSTVSSPEVVTVTPMESDVFEANLDLLDTDLDAELELSALDTDLSELDADLDLSALGEDLFDDVVALSDSTTELAEETESVVSGPAPDLDWSLDEVDGVEQLLETDLDLEDEAETIHQLVEADLEAFTSDLATTLEADAPGLFPGMGEEQGLFPVAMASGLPAGITPEAIQPISPEPKAAATASETDIRQRIKIPVPLERLDQSAQQVVETLLTARSTLSASKSLEFQISQLTALTQESAQYITRLRQLQDDYALLRSLSNQQDPANGTSVEQYRQGYVTINRLLENILRVSELSKEIENMTQQAVLGMSQLDRNMLRLKDGIEASRLVPFKNLTLRARAIVRDLTNRYDKPAQLVIRGEQLELDAGVIQQLEPALLHLLRNAYDHGLESAEERIRQGKPVQGTIQMTLQRRGNLYRLILQDDGRGIDAAAIQNKAKDKGFTLTQTETAADLLAVLCQPGFSSRNTADDVSGRGVGMDVVMGQITDMGGRLSLESRPGQGSTFTIEVPAPQLLVPCVLLQVGKRTVAIPTEEIRETVLASSIQVQSDPDAEGSCRWHVTTARGTDPGFDLAAYWQQPQAELSDTAVCMRVRQDADQTEGDIWLIADDLLGQEALLINPIPSPLVVPAGLLGISLQADGSLTSVIDPIALAEALQTQTQGQFQPQTQDTSPEPAEATAPTILIVDDAALMRRRLEGSLQTYGFVTHTCADGLEALQWLQTNRTPDLVITDIEMPNMDGFTLVDRCRTADMTMPILVVSSRLSEEWGREAKRLGANAYLNKGFATSDLIQQVTQLLESKTPQVAS